MKTIIGNVSLYLCSWLLIAVTPALGGDEIWITPTGSGGGTGTATDPYSATDADSFFNLIHDQRPGVTIPEYSTIHLMPGTFEVREGLVLGYKQRFCLTLKNGWKIRGAGMDVTVLKVIDNHGPASTGINNKLHVIAGNAIPGAHAAESPLDDAEVSDLTVDCNLQNQTIGHCPTAVGLTGSRNKISRVRAINWGSTIGGGVEGFPLVTTEHYTPRPQGYSGGVIEDCVVEQPAQVVHLTGSIGIAVGSGTGHPNSAGWTVRGCTVRNVTVGTGVGQPSTFGAYGSAGRGCEFYNNLAKNIINGHGGYQDTWVNQDIIWRDNYFVNVTAGITYPVNTYNCTNIAVLNNVIVFTNFSNGAQGGGVGFWAVGSAMMRQLRVEGNMIFPVVAGVTGTALSASGDIEISANNNILECGGGAAFDFASPGSEFAKLKILSFKNNHNLRGKPLKLGDWVYDFKFTGFYDEEMTFTPTTAGWHKLLLNQNISSARLNIWGYDTGGHSTDIGLAHRIWYYDSSLGDISLLYNNSSDSVGGISAVRLARYDTFSAEETSKGFQHPTTYDINIGSTLVGQPITVRISGMLRPPAYLNNFEPYPAPYAPIATRELAIGPGLRTTSLIYAGTSGQQLTDANGQIITAALNNNAVTDAKLRDSIATSVIGRSANNAGDTADIQATADGQYLRRAGGILGFGAIAASELGSGTADNTKFLRGDQQWASSVNSLRKSADQTISGAYVNVSDLTIPVLAGRDYTFEFTVVLTTSAGTEGYALAMSGPASTEFTYEVEARTSSTAQTQNFQFSANDAMTATGSGPGGTRTISRVRGVLRNPTTNGTLALRARPEGGGTVTIKQGSWGLWF